MFETLPLIAAEWVVTCEPCQLFYGGKIYQSGLQGYGVFTLGGAEGVFLLGVLLCEWRDGGAAGRVYDGEVPQGYIRWSREAGGGSGAYAISANYCRYMP